MDRNFGQEEILKWTGIFFDPDREFLKDISQNPDKYKKVFIGQIAKSLYEDMRRARMLITAPFTFNKEFDALSAEEKSLVQLCFRNSCKTKITKSVHPTV